MKDDGICNNKRPVNATIVNQFFEDRATAAENYRKYEQGAANVLL